MRNRARQHSNVVLATVLAVVFAAGAARAEQEPGYPTGLSTQEFAGLKFRLHIPEDYDPGKKYGLVVGLHGMGSSGVDFATWFEPLTFEGYIVCCPKSTGASWIKPDILKAKVVIRHLIETLSIDETRLHASGFSNGGAHLPFLVFDPKLPFATVCWMGSGFTGGKVPRSAKETMAVLALAGEKDRAYGAAKKTPDLLRKKVRYGEFRSQEELGHEIPDALMPYYYYWVRVMDGWCEAGEDESFDWAFDIESGREEMAERKLPGFVYFYLEEDGDSEEVRHLQHVVFFDPAVRLFGNQIVALKGEKEVDEEEYKALGLTKTPAVVVLAADGEPVATFEGKIDAAALAKALRSVAPRKR